MKTSLAHKLSKALEVIRDCSYAKANDLSYSKYKLLSAFRYIDEACIYIDNHSDDSERDFLFTAFGALDEFKEEGDYTKISRYANAIHRVPYLFCGEEKWDDTFKNQYIIPFCQIYGDEWFEELLYFRIPNKKSSQKGNRTIYRYNELNLMSLPAYFCFRMLIPLLVLPVVFGFLVYMHFSEYTDTEHGTRYEIAVTDCEYESDEFDYLYISCAEFEEEFEILRFFQFSNQPYELLDKCNSGEVLIVYAEYVTPERDDNYYKVIQLEDMDGTIYRSYEHTNQMEKYMSRFLLIVALVITVPFLILFVMMLIVATNREYFVSYPRFVKFCFPDYSLSLDKKHK